MGFTKHWPRMKNHGMENQEVLLVRIKWEVPLNLAMGNHYLYSALLIRDFNFSCASALHIQNFSKDVDQEPYFLKQ
jgi:hypothetical protein